MKRILALVLAAVLLFAALPASAETSCTSTARTACENCPFGGDWLKSGCIGIQFLSLPLNEKTGRHEGTGTVNVGGVNASIPFIDPNAEVSALIVGGVLQDVTATGTIPGTGQMYAVRTLSITPDGPWYDVKLELATVANKGQLRKFLDGGESK